MTKSAKKKPAPARSQGPGSAAKPLPAVQRKAKEEPTPAAASVLPGPATKASDRGGTAKPNNSNSGTKQSRVLAMLRSSAGATIAAMMQATGWQQHSVRGFLAGVVRKRLNLKLSSKKLAGNRIYRIASRGYAKANPRQSKRTAA